MVRVDQSVTRPRTDISQFHKEQVRGIRKLAVYHGGPIEGVYPSYRSTPIGIDADVPAQFTELRPYSKW
jgi:hypothetical protein